MRNGGNVWSGLTINQVQLDKALVLRTSKTSQPVVHALDKCPLVVRCVEALDRTDPLKPVAARPDGEPWGDRQAFSKAWRKYAKAAGIPNSVWISTIAPLASPRPRAPAPPTTIWRATPAMPAKASRAGFTSARPSRFPSASRRSVELREAKLPNKGVWK